jgi:hypothetical protein
MRVFSDHRCHVVFVSAYVLVVYCNDESKERWWSVEKSGRRTRGIKEDRNIPLLVFCESGVV